MASIFKRHDSPNWFAAYTDASGQRRQKCTKTTDRKVALKFAVELEELASSGRNRTLTEAAARQAVSRLVEQSTGKPVTFYTVEAWFNEWLANRKGTAASRTLERYEGTCADFLKALGVGAKKALITLTGTDIREYRDALRKKGHSAPTCNQSLKILSAPLEYARKLGVIPVNPVHGVVPLKDSKNAAREAFTIDQIRALLKKAKGTDWEGCIYFGAFCGLRLKDAANITWASIDFDAGLLSAEPTKTERHGVKVTVPLHPALLEWLRGRQRGIGKAPVLPALAGKSGSGKSGLSMAFKRLMEAAGIVGEIARKGSGAGRTTSTLSFHSTRHFFVSALSSEGVPADVRQRLAGHTDAKTHAVYAAHEIDSMRAAIAKLPPVSA